MNTFEQYEQGDGYNAGDEFGIGECSSRGRRRQWPPRLHARKNL